MNGRPHPNPDASLVGEFDDVIDEMRQLQTDVGARPYRVFAVVIEWSGKEVGKGDPRVIVERELLPTPLVRLRGVRVERTSIGKAERGYTELSELSPGYTEEELQRSFHVKQLTEGVEAFYEIQQDRRDPGAPRRRFTLVSPPERDVENFQWVLRLGRQDPDRARDGKPAKPRRKFRE